MKPSPLASVGLALALLAPSVPAAGLLGLDAGVARKQPIQVTAVPDAHWRFEPSGGATRVEGYSPNLDGVGFGNNGADGQGACYGHSLASIRWFQYLTKPLANGTVERITPDEFTDFWGGRMGLAPTEDITPANAAGYRLQPFSTRDEASRVAVGRLIGFYHDYQHNLFDHGWDKYVDGVRFVEDLQQVFRQRQLPSTMGLFEGSGGHAVAAYKVQEGTALWGNTAGQEGERVRAWRVSFYDPNLAGQGDPGQDPRFEALLGLVVFESGAVGFSEVMELHYAGFLRQDPRHPDGTWALPGQGYGLGKDVSDDSNEISAWHWRGVSDEDARTIAGLEPAD